MWIGTPKRLISEIYSVRVHFVHILGLFGKHSNVTTVDFSGLEVFKRSVMTKSKQLSVSVKLFKSRAHKVFWMCFGQ